MEPKIVARPWKPQDLIDDLELLIDEENDSYMNPRLSTMLTARDFLKEYFSKLDLLQSPFDNDPFSLVWIAFKNLYPGKEFKAFYDQHQNDQHDEEYGFTHFPDDGSTPSVFIYAEHSVNIQVETFAHELPTSQSDLSMSTTTSGGLPSTPYSKSTTGSETSGSGNPKEVKTTMMTLDEAIAHAREVAEGKHQNIDGCSECATQHAQLAEWLEELRWHRDLYRTDPECILVFSERRKLADAFTVWAEPNGLAQTPESVIAYLLSEGLLNVKKCQHLISERGVKP